MSESSARERISESPEEGDVPPMVSCAVCRRPDCAGCEVTATRPLSLVGLAWEGSSAHWMRRLWFTALASSTEPQKTFGELPEGRVAPALAFALLAESLAVGSLGSALVLAALAVAPEFSLRVLATPMFLLVALSSLCALSLLMVALHVLWGLCVEFGAQSTGGNARFGQGMRFGLYACGWDLLTSPAGVVEGLLSRGFFAAWRPIVQAARVPRTALRAYVEDCRHLDASAQRRGLQLSIAVLGGLLLLILLGVLFALLRLAELLGY